jgi:thiol:disulfide interchange protein DsbA
MRPCSLRSTKNDADPEEFDQVFDSFQVNAKMRRAENLAQRFRIRSTPTIVVNGKYLTDLGDAGGPEPMVRLGQWLLEQE